jgi:hypothetical protein
LTPIELKNYAKSLETNSLALSPNTVLGTISLNTYFNLFITVRVLRSEVEKTQAYFE